MAKHYPLPKRFNVALSEAAYARIRKLNETWQLGNNYLLTALLERLDAYADPTKLDQVFKDFIDEYGAPKSAMKK